MCGIAGYLNFDEHRKVEVDVLEHMTKAIAHRGPDSAGFFVNGTVGIGFRRLSIIDLETGDQPIFNEDKSIVAVCNGEIFNYVELRSELVQRGHTVRTKSDVEVIVHLYEEEEAGFLNRLNGQFAFVIYDSRRRQLLLARDHVGINPLFYAVTRDSVVFGSEIKAVLAHPTVRPEIDLIGLDQLVSLPGLVGPRTMFRGISSLQSGHYAVIKDREIRLREYWDLEYPRPDEMGYDRPERYYVEALDGLLARAVKYRLQADVPVGCYLSGGLDSSLVAAKIRSVCPDASFSTFSIAFMDQSISEARYQRRVAQTVRSIHHEVPFDCRQITELLPAVVWHSECPLKETYNTASLLLSRCAKAAGTSVVLCGEGADELFAGYVGYRFDVLRSRGTLAQTHDIGALLERQLRHDVWGDANLVYEKNYAAFRSFKRMLYSETLAQMLPSFDCFNHALVNRERVCGRHLVHQRSYLDFKLRLSDHLLADHGDRMALANAVEARYPFLDVELIDFVRLIPTELKLKGFVEKYILKKIAEGIVPSEVVRREKFAFVAPGSPCLLRENVEWVNDLLSEHRIRQEGYFNPVTIERLKREWRRDNFRLHVPFEDDVLVLVLTFGMFRQAFSLAAL